MSECKFHIDFIKHRKIYFTISAILMIFCIVSTFIFGAKLDIQFKGGTLITYLYEGDIDISTFQSDASAALDGIGIKATTGTDFNTGKNNIQLSMLSNSGLTADKQILLTNTLTEKYADNNLELIESTDVSPSAAIVLIIYIAVRFKNIGGWLAGVCAVAALLHDIIVVYGTFIVCGMEIDANFMAVVLTIFGYSINSTIVIYDRIRENQKLYGKKLSLGELTNLSVNQSMTRSINTNVTTVSAMIVISIVAMVYGVNSIISVSFPMTMGLISGAYSSTCIAGPLWVWLEEKKAGKGKPKAAPEKSAEA